MTANGGGGGAEGGTTFTDDFNVIFRLAKSNSISTHGGVEVEKDVVIRVSHKSAIGMNVTILTYSFHAGFMDHGMVRISRDELELNARDLNSFSRIREDFCVDLVFSRGLEMRIDAGERKWANASVLLSSNTISPPTSPTTSYAPFLGRKVFTKQLCKLVQFHNVHADAMLIRVFEGQGHARLLGREHF